MGRIVDSMIEGFRQVLIDANMSAFAGMFDNVNSSVEGVASQVGQTPQSWNASIFAMIQNLSESVILPVAGVILTFVLCYELIQLIIERNNMTDVVLYKRCFHIILNLRLNPFTAKRKNRLKGA